MAATWQFLMSSACVMLRSIMPKHKQLESVHPCVARTIAVAFEVHGDRADELLGRLIPHQHVLRQPPLLPDLVHMKRVKALQGSVYVRVCK